MQWTGHMRMGDNRITKQLFYRNRRQESIHNSLRGLKIICINCIWMWNIGRTDFKSECRHIQGRGAMHDLQRGTHSDLPTNMQFWKCSVRGHAVAEAGHLNHLKGHNNQKQTNYVNLPHYPVNNTCTVCNKVCR